MPVIHGRVRDVKGAPVAQAAVYVIAAPHPQPDIAQLTGDDGGFEVDVGGAGTYVIGARADAAGEGRAEAVVTPGEPDVSVTITLTRG
jgi:hypothetical protein